MVYYVGLMSGTSADGIDAALVSFENSSIEVIKSTSTQYCKSLFENIVQVCANDSVNLNQLGELDARLGHAFSDAAIELIKNIDKDKIVAIGSHGQTIYHSPSGDYPFTMQLGSGAIIAQRTGINTVVDFRSNDIAANGQGAPLAPLFHQQCFTSKKENRAIVNIGGIANITYLSSDNSTPLFGFDTGPGNALLDAWTQKHLNLPYDNNGDWASHGELIESVLMDCLNDSYFKKMPPKSTGKEYFNLNWLSTFINLETADPQNIQTTVAHLTAYSIAQSINEFAPLTDCLYLCGGGAKNSFMIKLIEHYTDNRPVYTTAKLGIDPDFVEAVAFAWLAKCRIEHTALDTASVTGASKPVTLGSVYLA